MCFICEIVTQKEKLSDEQRGELFPLAAALGAAKVLAAKIQGRPSTLHLCRLAQLRGASLIPQLYALALAFEGFREAACSLVAANNRATAEAVLPIVREAMEIPPDLSQEDAAQILKLNEQVKRLSVELIQIDGSMLRKLYNASRSPIAQNIARILGEAREEILSQVP